MSTPYVLGMNAKAYQGAAGAPLTALTEISNIKNLTLTLEAGEADVTTRANSGWEATAATLRKCTAEFEMLYKPGDLTFQAVKAAFLSADNVRLALLTGAVDGEDAEGPVGDFSISNFSRNEPLIEGVSVPVTAKLAVWGIWLEPPIVADQAFEVVAASENNTAVGTVVTTQGADMIAEAEVFSIVTQSTAGVFKIDAGTGAIAILSNTSLGDAGTVHTVSVKVDHTTSGLPYATATITITVTAE